MELQKASTKFVKCAEHGKDLRNWVRYLEVEATQKEKEYGIPWRSAFKHELKESVEQLMQRQIAEKVHNQLVMENKFEVLKAIVENHLAEVETNQADNNADRVLILQENYRFLERHVKYLKALLKEEDLKRFPEIKQRVLVL